MDHPTDPPVRSDSAGQTTAEYALVILAAAALATILIAWATHSTPSADSSMPSSTVLGSAR